MNSKRWAVCVVTSAVILSVMSCGESDDGPGPNTCDPDLVLVAGDAQVAELSTQLPDTLVVLATTCDEGSQVPEPGVRIAWLAGAGTVNGVMADTVLTDASGLARAVWVLGPSAGTQNVSATALRSPSDAVTFSATATAPPGGCPANSVQHAGGFFTTSETWGQGGHVVTGNVSFGGTATLTIAAGAHVCFEGDGGIEVTEESHLAIRGTAAAPVVIEASSPFGGALTFGVNMSGLTTPSTITSARLEGVNITVSGWFHPVVVESTLVRDAEVIIGAPGSGFRHSTIVRGRLNVHAAQGGPILIEATVRDFSQEGIFINGSGVTLSGCEVTGCGTDGVVSSGDATTIHINGSNFHDNAGVGVWNGVASALDASGNWWGDPAGPTGPNGDGVSGNVDYSGALPAPVLLGYRPPE